MLGSMIISLSFFAYNYTQNRAYLEEKTNNNADSVIQRMAQNLVVPLWEVDDTWAGVVADTEIVSDEIKAITITGEGDLNVFRERTEEGSIQTQKAYSGTYFIKRTAPILHDGQIIGEVTVFFSDRTLKKELARELISNISLAVLIILFLLIAPVAILDHLILHPLQKILTVVKNSDKDNYVNRVEISRPDQIGSLAHEFNNMMDNIKSKEKMILSQSRHAAMGEMISMIAHQWRQPITAIAMGANNLLFDVLSKETDPETVQHHCEKIIDQTIHLSKTIDDFKNFFSPDKSRELVDINETIDECFAVIGKSIEHNNITVEKNYEDIEKVWIFSRELLQVMINIINNAKEALVEFNVPDPTISLKSSADNYRVYISICNNGYPIEEDVLLKIFEPYFTTKDEKNGTGLGLYMSKIIIEKHFEGSLSVRNLETGGVCFDISFPKHTPRSINE